MTSISCSATGSDTYLVIDDADEVVTVGEQMTRNVKNVAGEGLARYAEMPPVKSVQADVVYDLISSLKVYAIK